MIARCSGRRVFCRIVLPAFTIIAIAAGCSRQPPPAPDVARPVKTIIVTAGAETQVRTFPGKVEAAKKVELAFQVPGKIVELPIKEGVTKLAKGDVIAKIRPDDFEADLKAVQGDLDKARAKLKALQAGERPEERLRREAKVRQARALAWRACPGRRTDQEPDCCSEQGSH